MSRRNDTDYLAISARIRAMENRLLTPERMNRMIEARDDGEAMKVLAECGYGEGGSLESVLAQARADTLTDIARSVPDQRLVELFQLKYDYHNAKAIVKAQAMNVPAERLLLPGGRYDANDLLEGWQREELRGCSEAFRRAMAEAKTVLAETHDPQQADLLLDRACYREMADLADVLGSLFLQGYVRLTVDVANLRTAVRVHRMGKEGDFLRRVLLPGGSVSEQILASARSEGLADVFRTGPLAQAAELGAKLAQPGGGSLTAFEKACDDAVTTYLTGARMVAFGEEPVVGYLYAKEAEMTAIRTIFAGRAAGLDGDTIRARLRMTYA